jgi:hypothetical protein
MKASDQGQRAPRLESRPTVLLTQVPTVYPAAALQRTEPKAGAVREFLRRLQDRMHQLVFVPDSCNWMWRDGETNPATGLPMYGGVDSAGNPYGTDMRIAWSRPPSHQCVLATPLVPFHDSLSFESIADERPVTMDSIDRRWRSADSF